MSVFELRFPDEPKPVPNKPVAVRIKGELLIEHHLLCPDHDLRMRLVYNKKHDSLYYRCPDWVVTGCCGTIGAHKETGEPVGWPCDHETKAARRLAHEAFDPIWRSGYRSRAQAYFWMQKVMKLSADKAHIGKFDKTQCEALIRHVHRDFPGQ